MIHFFRFTAHTPIPGEEQDYYTWFYFPEVGGIEVDSGEDEIENYATSSAIENADEWFNDDGPYSEEEYYEECYADWEEISREKYFEHTGFVDALSFEELEKMYNDMEEN